MILDISMSFKPDFSLSSFIKRLFSSSLLSAIRVVSSAYLRLLIFLQIILIPAWASSSPAFCMMYSAYKSNKQGGNIQPWHAPFPIWNQSVVPCPVLTVASRPAYRFLRRQVRESGTPISFGTLTVCCDPHTSVYWLTFCTGETERSRHTTTGNPGAGWAVFSSGGSTGEESTFELVQAAGWIQLLVAAGWGPCFLTDWEPGAAPGGRPHLSHVVPSSEYGIPLALQCSHSCLWPLGTSESCGQVRSTH